MKYLCNFLKSPYCIKTFARANLHLATTRYTTTEPTSCHSGIAKKLEVN